MTVTRASQQTEFDMGTDMNPDAHLDAAQNWLPPEAPLEMPRQVLERETRRTEWPRLLRLILPGKAV
ncbi:hypothetical protein [Celeribacter sp. PS-C1]|uniref:hypothetical protein n=1 Tax=Celeribacter sp. PS-C1 TaxID=2820813 RepID=UPI001CA5DE6E|nr:hypothetical protein [Celeribacter sp. PS-C1]MBW6417706.1 hypothetical protein [Celeribacter sp. PS-C1]